MDFFLSILYQLVSILSILSIFINFYQFYQLHYQFLSIGLTQISAINYYQFLISIDFELVNYYQLLSIDGNYQFYQLVTPTF